MWRIKILSGSQKGKSYSLKSGSNKFGRGEQSDCRIDSAQVSKQHFEIVVRDDKFFLKDLESSNGTFVNGVRVRNALLKKGDKIAVHDIVLELTDQTEAKSSKALSSPTRPVALAAQPQLSPNLSSHHQEEVISASEISLESGPNVFDPAKYVDKYLEKAVYPALFQLTHKFDLRIVVIGFSLVFVFVMTLLAIVPMSNITQETVQTESRRRALTLARALAQANEKVVRNNDFASYTTDLILREDGIEDVFIISKDGAIIAPSERVGSRPKQAGFINQIRGAMRESSAVLSSNQIIASAPILAFDSDLQQNTAKATVVVVYDPQSLTFSDGRAFSMFFQMLLISLLLGFGMFYLLAQVAEYPLQALKKNLDELLAHRTDHLQLPIKSKALSDVIINLNSLISRAGMASGPQLMDQPGLNETEIRNVIKIMGFPALLLNKLGMIVDVNHQFEALTGYTAGNLVQKNLSALPDQALQKNLQELVAKAQAQSQVIAQDQIEIASMMLSIQCQALGAVSGGADFYLISFAPLMESQGGAA